MYLTGIGHLVHVYREEVWRLTYSVCGHTQDLARSGLEVERVAEEIRRDYARCLECRVLRNGPHRARARQSGRV